MSVSDGEQNSVLVLKCTIQAIIIKQTFSLPEVNSVVQGCVTVAIFSIDGGAVTQ